MTPGANPTRELETVDVRIPIQPRLPAKRARAVAIGFFTFAAILAFAALVVLNGCTSTGQGRDVHLRGTSGEMFRKLTGARAMTLSERVVVHGGENPPSEYTVCHEGEHQTQAKIVGDVHVKMGFIDDDEWSRAAAWIDVYKNEWLQRGYTGSRFERGAHEACKHLLGAMRQ